MTYTKARQFQWTKLISYIGTMIALGTQIFTENFRVDSHLSSLPTFDYVGNIRKCQLLGKHVYVHNF